MPEYDEFAESYHRWSDSASPYSVIELYSFLKVLGSVKGLDVLDLAAGEGRISRLLMERGANSVLGADLSSEMIKRADTLNIPEGKEADRNAQIWQNLSYRTLDARDEAFQMDSPVDIVTAMYLFHYAEDKSDLEKMCRLISRSLKPGGRFVTYTLSPDYDFSRAEPLLKERCGFDYAVVAESHSQLLIGDQAVNIWQWSREDHEDCLHSAGFTDICWHPLEVPEGSEKVGEWMKFYLANPSCTVLSAKKSE
ncbi:MAG: class I SAM-dependent methyltransferase [Proteobacteria bacterium]|nr:class I SAM-dependent methyltransferase [Pseudomonadota bacterium]